MEELKQSKKKLTLIILVLLVISAGAAIAYFTNSTTLPNTFRTKAYATKTTEVFTSPNDWTPGTTTNKTVTTKNTGEQDVAVRIHYTESWVDKNGNPLPLEQNDNPAAIIYLPDPSRWVKSTENGTDYYYYKYLLEPGDETTSLIEAVEFNPDISNSSNCTTVNQKTTCQSTGTGYDDATYTLTFYIETIQYDHYQDGWNTNLSITKLEGIPDGCFSFDEETGTINRYYPYEYNNPSGPACPTEITIPKTINGVAVTAIGEEAFSYNNLVSIVIPNTITSIGPYAFLKYSGSNENLTNITFEAGNTAYCTTATNTYGNLHNLKYGIILAESGSIPESSININWPDCDIN